MQVSFECRDPNGRKLRGFVVSRIRHSLRRVTWLVPRAEVHMADINGPKGGTDKQCRVTLSMRQGSPVVISAIAREWRTSVNLAVSRAVYALLRAWRRTGERRRRASSPPARHREAHGS